jgi:enamine deaminase RidA (YjgF/YER057c/UK114 family)
MDWEIKKRGCVTYYRKKTNTVFSDLVVEELENRNLKIRFVGMTGARAATNELGLDDLASMDPTREIPRVFDTWQMYVKEAGICDSLADLDFLEVHSFGAAPKTPNPIVDPEGYLAEKTRIRQAYHQAYSQYWQNNMPDSGLPARFTVYLEELPDVEASYELSATALYQHGSES